MNPPQRDQFLHAYGPGRGAEEDRDLLQALEEAQKDPSVRQQLAAEEAFDRAFAAKLREVTPPPGLKERILAQQGGLSGSDSPSVQDEGAENHEAAPATTSRSFWQQAVPWVTAMAAAIILTIGVVLFSPAQQVTAAPDLDSLLEAVGQHATNIRGLERRPSLEELRTILANQGMPVPEIVPGTLESLPPKGCLGVTLKGIPLGLVCFEGDHVYHLYTMDRAHLPNLEDMAEPMMKDFGRTSAATWTGIDQLYILVCEGSMDDLKQFF